MFAIPFSLAKIGARRLCILLEILFRVKTTRSTAAKTFSRILSSCCSIFSIPDSKAPDTELLIRSIIDEIALSNKLPNVLLIKLLIGSNNVVITLFTVSFPIRSTIELITPSKRASITLVSSRFAVAFSKVDSRVEITASLAAFKLSTIV